MSSASSPAYLEPYARAVKRHGAEFRALLWASRRTQEQRFAALVHLQDPSGLTLLDLGCGRADFLDFLLARGAAPRKYIGLEAVPELAAAAQAKHPRGKGPPPVRIVSGDFVRQPRCLDVGADIIYCSGALNTLEASDFYATLTRAFAAARTAVVFNFLCSDLLAGVNYLHWHRPREVLDFARSLTPSVARHQGYIDGDCTIALRKDRS